MSIDWPKLTEGAVVLYEHADAACPQRLVLVPLRGGYRIEAQGLLNSLAAPPLSRNDLFHIASHLLNAIAWAHTEETCPGHVASEADPKVCDRCGTHVDSMRPPDDGEDGS